MQPRSSRAPVDLLPLMRSETQFRLLGELFLDPDREWSLTELAGRIGSSPSAVSREVDRLETAGIVHSRRQGNVRLVAAKLDSSIGPDLHRLLLKAYGPAQVVREELRQVDGVEVARIFGSWAQRAHGVPGPPPRDVDVLVIGQMDPLDVYDACRRAGERLDLDVNPVVRTAEEWDADDSEFAAQVRREPVVDVTPEAGDGDG